MTTVDLPERERLALMIGVATKALANEPWWHFSRRRRLRWVIRDLVKRLTSE